MKKKLFGIEDEFAIGGYIAPTPKLKEGDYDTITERVYKDMHECGLNFIDSLSLSMEKNEEAFERQMALGEKYGVNIIVADENASKGKDCDTEKMIESVKRYYKYKAFVGIHGKDEPTIDAMDYTARNKKAFDANFKDKDFFVNFLPNYGTDEMLIGKEKVEGDKYEYYLDKAIEKIDLSYISFDYYPFVGQGNSFLKGYYKNLEAISNRAKKAKIPFISCIQATSWCESYARYVNYAEMSFLIKSAIAFGAKGIIYFTYAVPISELPEGESFSQALIDTKGDRTERYYYAKANNEHLQKIGKILNESENEGIIQVGESFDEIPKRILIERYKRVEKIEAKHTIVGCFDYKGEVVLYVMNNSVLESDEIAIELDGEYETEIYVDTTKIANKGKSIKITVGAGNGFLVHIKK